MYGHHDPDGPSTAELLASTSQTRMADLGHDLLRRHRVRWLGHAAIKPYDAMVDQVLFAHPSGATLGLGVPAPYEDPLVDGLRHA